MSARLTAPLVDLLNIQGNPAHTTTGGVNSMPLGLWADGPIVPYQTDDGLTHFNLLNSESYRMTAPDWNKPQGWTLTGAHGIFAKPGINPNIPASVRNGACYLSARDTDQSKYNNREWPFAPWSMCGNRVIAIAHHEWYWPMLDPATTGGIPGFPRGHFGKPDGHQWVNALTMLQSTDGGRSFSPMPTANSTRCIIIPKPFDPSKEPIGNNYGYYHPTRIVRSGLWYYLMAGAIFPGAGAKSGSIMLRTMDITTATGWQYHDRDGGWTTVNHGTWQGAGGEQEPYLFNLGSFGAHQSILQWGDNFVTFGFHDQFAGKLCYAMTDSLSKSPRSLENLMPIDIGGSDPAAFTYARSAYLSAFDTTPRLEDRNFQHIVDPRRVRLLVAYGTVGWRQTFIDLSDAT